MVFGLGRRKSETEKFFEGQEKRAKALSKAEKELQIQEERVTVFKAREKARKVRARAEKLSGKSGGGGMRLPGNPDAIADILGGQPSGKGRKKEKNMFRM